MAGQYYYKIILLGDAGVGKTSLFRRIKTGKFEPSQPNTQGADQYTYTTTIGDDSVSVTLWDTAGGERFRTLTNNFYRDAHGAMLVYSVEDSYTFENLNNWIVDASPYINPDIFEWALIGNKCDLNNEIEKGRVEARLQQLEANIFYHVSAKTGENVMQVFKKLISTIHIRSSPSPSTPRTTRIDLTGPATTNGKRGSCCK